MKYTLRSVIMLSFLIALLTFLIGFRLGGRVEFLNKSYVPPTAVPSPTLPITPSPTQKPQPTDGPTSTPTPTPRPTVTPKSVLIRVTVTPQPKTTDTL